MTEREFDESKIEININLVWFYTVIKSTITLQVIFL